MGHLTKCEWGSVPGCLSDSKGCLAVGVQEYATAQDMVQSTCLKLGYAHTLGFYEVGDGGAAYYTVGDSGTPNGMDVLQGRKYKCALVTQNTMSPMQYGAHGDGITDDSKQVQRAIAKSKVSSEKWYAVADVECSIAIVDGLKLVAQTACQNVINVARGSKINRLEINGNGQAKNGIHTYIPIDVVSSSTPESYLENCVIYTCLDSDAFLEDSTHIDNSRFCSSEIGISINANDIKINMCMFVNCRAAVANPLGGCFIENSHAWVLRKPSDSALYNEKQDDTPYPGTSCFVLIDKASLYPSYTFTNNYADTLTYFLDIKKTNITYAKLVINGFRAFWNTSFYNAEDPKPTLIHNSKTLIGNNHIILNDIYTDMTITGLNEYVELDAPIHSYYAIPKGLISQTGMSYPNDTTKPTTYKTLNYFDVSTSYLGAYRYCFSISEFYETKIYYLAGINTRIPNGNTVAVLTAQQITQFTELVLASAYYENSDGTRTPITIKIGSNTIEIINNTGTTLQNGRILILPV